jgi:hypothetical protein
MIAEGKRGLLETAIIAVSETMLCLSRCREEDGILKENFCNRKTFFHRKFSSGLVKAAIPLLRPKSEVSKKLLTIF